MNTPDYKHRTFVSAADNAEKFDCMDLIDSVNMSVEQAEAIALQMQCQFEGHGNISSDAVNFSVLDAIRKELLDIKVVVDWYAQNNLDKQVEKNNV